MRAQEFVTETINPDILNKRFRHKQVIGDYTYTASVEMFIGEPLLNIKVYDGNNEIGHAMFEVFHWEDQPAKSHIESGGTEVDPKYRNKGIASTMYAYAKMLGNDIRASSNRTPQGKAMWAAWDKSGDAKHLAVAENMDHSKDSQAVEELKSAMLARKQRLQSAGNDQVYDIIDKIMTRIAKSHGMSGQKLHDMWVNKYKQIPDTWIMKEDFDDLEEGWKDWVAGAALGAAALAPQNADAKVAPQQKPAITQQVQGNADYATKLILKPEAKILIQSARAAGMRGKELAQFIAQCAHETANFSSLKEKGGSLDFKKYDPKHNPRKAKMLGNKQAGDGARYHGRGYIQLTGRDNYRRAGQALGLPLEAQPELVERPDVAAKVAVWFWQNQVAPRVTNFNDTASVTKPINSGLKGLDDRHNKFASIMALMQTKG
jgi:predicted chitinase/GNAT superfamily N-acetyltransferase